MMADQPIILGSSTSRWLVRNRTPSWRTRPRWHRERSHYATLVRGQCKQLPAGQSVRDVGLIEWNFEGKEPPISILMDCPTDGVLVAGRLPDAKFVVRARDLWPAITSNRAGFLCCDIFVLPTLRLHSSGISLPDTFLYIPHSQSWWLPRWGMIQYCENAIFQCPFTVIHHFNGGGDRDGIVMEIHRKDPLSIWNFLFFIFANPHSMK